MVKYDKTQTIENTSEKLYYQKYYQEIIEKLWFKVREYELETMTITVLIFNF